MGKAVMQNPDMKKGTGIVLAMPWKERELRRKQAMQSDKLLMAELQAEVSSLKGQLAQWYAWFQWSQDQSPGKQEKELDRRNGQSDQHGAKTRKKKTNEKDKTNTKENDGSCNAANECIHRLFLEKCDSEDFVAELANVLCDSDVEQILRHCLQHGKGGGKNNAVPEGNDIDQMGPSDGDATRKLDAELEILEFLFRLGSDLATAWQEKNLLGKHRLRPFVAAQFLASEALGELMDQIEEEGHGHLQVCSDQPDQSVQRFLERMPGLRLETSCQTHTILQCLLAVPESELTQEGLDAYLDLAQKMTEECMTQLRELAHKAGLKIADLR